MTRRIIRQIEGTDGGAAIQVLEGRYGPYVTDGETNASIPKGLDPATISLQDARGLLEARRAAPPREKRAGRFGRTAARKAPRAAAAVRVAAPVGVAPVVKQPRAAASAKPRKPARAAKSAGKSSRRKTTVH